MSTHPDAAIIAGLHQWRDAIAAYMDDARCGDDDAWTAMVGAADDILRDTIAIPAATTEGLAIKAWLALRYEFGGVGPRDLGIELDGGSMCGEPLAPLIADVVRLSPALAATVA